MTSTSSPTPPERQRELVALVADLGPTFAERAAGYDRDARFPHENYADLRAAGLLGLCVPARYGGLGADFATYGLVSEELGRYCGSTALTFNMHTATMLLCGQIADDLEMSSPERATHERRRAAMYAGVVDDGHIHAQPFSEGNAPGATAGVTTTAVPVDGGWRLERAQDLRLALPRRRSSQRDLRGPRRPHDPVHERADRQRGAPLQRRLGPAGDARHGVADAAAGGRLRARRRRVAAPPGVFDQVAFRWPHFYLTLSFTFLGIMRAVMDFTDDYLAGRIGPGSRRDNPQKQAGWAEMQVSYERSHALAGRVLREAGPDPTLAQVRRAWASMVSTMETAPELASLAVRVCGGRSLLRPQPLERLYRDARCGATMLPWSVEACLDRLGRAGLSADETGGPHA